MSLCLSFFLFQELPSYLLMWSLLLRDHLSYIATLSGYLELKHIENEHILKSHLS